MKTIFMLMAQYEGKVIIPIEQVRKDFFPHLLMMKFLRKVSDGLIPLPIIRIEKSQKAHRGVHVHDLADFIDARREEALTEAKRTALPGY